MSGAQDHLEGFEAPVHRALVEPILLGGAPRGLAILNGTLAAALGLGLRMWIAGLIVWAIGHTLAVFAAALGLGLQQWIAGLLLWAVGHSVAVIAAKRDQDFAPVLMRHLRQRAYLSC